MGDSLTKDLTCVAATGGPKHGPLSGRKPVFQGPLVTDPVFGIVRRKRDNPERVRRYIRFPGVGRFGC